MEMVLVGLGGGLGAVSRYLITQLIRGREFPWATLLVNVLGSFILGLALFSMATEGLLLFVGVGFCGAFTTFSSFSFQTVGLWERGEPLRALLYAVGTLVLALVGFGAAWGVVLASPL